MGAEDGTEAALRERIEALGGGHDEFRKGLGEASKGAVAELDEDKALLDKVGDEQDKRLKSLAGLGGSVDGASREGVMQKLARIEKQQVALEAELEAKHAREMKELREKMAALEAEIAEKKREAMEERANAVAASSAPVVMSVNTDGVEAAGDAADDARVNSEARSKEAKSHVAQAASDRQVAAEAAEAAEAAAAAANAAEETLEGLKEYVEKRRNPPVQHVDREMVLPKADPNVVKKRAKIDLNTIEAVMNSHQGVRSAMAWTTNEVGAVDHEVHCAVVPRKGARLSTQWMKLHAQTMLPVMQVPKKFFVLDSLPASREVAAASKDLEAELCKPKPERLFVRAPQWKFSPPKPEDPSEIPAYAKKLKKQQAASAKKAAK
mmetsp:Transcript_14833/g.31814  ORF Transcript_14833/g.31814 Transcript_14833/m.31814 type:complete len:380 (+) Transcript_14833:54-1193(+)